MNTKNIHISYLIITIGVLIYLTSCEKDDFISPRAKFSLVIEDSVTKNEIILQEPYILKVGKTVTYKDKSTGDNVVIWLGDEGHNYDEMGQNLNSKGSSGEIGGTKNITYKKAGNYTFVVIATSFDYAKDKFEEDILKTPITVIE